MPSTVWRISWRSSRRSCAPNFRLRSPLMRPSPRATMSTSTFPTRLQSATLQKLRLPARSPQQQRRARLRATATTTTARARTLAHLTWHLVNRTILAKAGRTKRMQANLLRRRCATPSTLRGRRASSRRRPRTRTWSSSRF
eukprot:Amastigsp_a850282_5.p4 type:complete len:141 gc:universal Amastigsp_a850282_5:248-670(+)